MPVRDFMTLCDVTRVEVCMIKTKCANSSCHSFPKDNAECGTTKDQLSQVLFDKSVDADLCAKSFKSTTK